MSQQNQKTIKIYEDVYNRYISTLGEKQDATFITKNRLIIGLGNENVLETGITLHHTYGTPYIPGTALKGLAAHYCNQVWGKGDEKFKKDGEYYKAIFGTSDDSGHFIFHDAWITPESLKDKSLMPDVMTPHHGDYYSEKGAPTDFDKPVPISFVSVRGMFHIVVSCDVSGENTEKWTKLVFRLLSEALENWGIGGKTSSGYGKLVKIESFESQGNNSQYREIRATNAAQIPVQQQVIPKRGDIVYATYFEDHVSKKRNVQPHFKIDGYNNLFGFVNEGTLPEDLELKKSYELVVISNNSGGPGKYSFAVPGSWNPDENRQRKPYR
ncbi:type III-B CRISPR module RAMP protein Cmr6 [Methanolacinia paynteri]|uniref:type III-B CRISPR module RAMP protein Cmr6 n=1 Tax=Methanolacinia paynteri TaxID=230356 RepID=UPI00146FE16A|nr:type III-B CRISPR module RAMP protein Cmr6 [Methanolacinia paynteri]